VSKAEAFLAEPSACNDTLFAVTTLYLPDKYAVLLFMDTEPFLSSQ